MAFFRIFGKFWKIEGSAKSSAKKVMTSIYDSIRELDGEMNGGQRVKEMTIENYMVPPPFWKLGGSPEVGVVIEEPIRAKIANSTNRIRVKNIRTGVLIEFDKMINAARFVGTTGINMRCGIGYVMARVYRVGEEEYVFEYDGQERLLDGDRFSSLDGSVVAISDKGERIPFPSYLSIAKYLGLLVGHILEEKKRELAKKYVLGKETFTIEFEGKRRRKDHGRGIVCYWKGIYDEDFEEIGGVGGIRVTYGKPMERECLTI